MTDVVLPDPSVTWHVSEISNLRIADGTLVSNVALKYLPTWLYAKLVETINQDFFLKKEVQEAAGEVQGKGINVEIDNGILRLNIGTRKFAFDGDSMERLGNVVESVKNYIRRIGLDPFGGAFFEKTAHKAKRLSVNATDPREMRRAVFQVDEAAHKLFDEPPKSESQLARNVVTGSGLVLNLSSLSRDVMSLYDTPKVNHASVLLRDTVFTPLLLLSSLYSAYSSIGGVQAKKEMKDKEGVEDAKIGRVSSGTLLGGTLLFTGSTITDRLGAFSIAETLGSVSGYFFGVTGLIGLSMGVRNIVRCNRFSDRIDAFMKNETLTEEQKVVGTLNMLRDQVILSDSETKKLIEEVSSMPELTKEEKQELLEKRARDLMLTKISRLNRRAGSESLKKILHEVDDLLMSLDAPQLKTEALERAKSLIKDVQKENTKRKIFYAIILLASILSITAFIIGTISTGFMLPFVLGLIGSLIKLTLVIYSISYQWLSKDNAFPHAIEGLAALDGVSMADEAL